MAIYFYASSAKYGAFSNFSHHCVRMDEQRWPTVEHYFQAQKFSDAQYREEIRAANTPMEARRLGSSRKFSIRADWEEVKIEIMYETCLVKFLSHKRIRNLLFSTWDEELIQNAPNDYYWGCGRTGKGQNVLGGILMAVRTELRYM